MQVFSRDLLFKSVPRAEKLTLTIRIHPKPITLYINTLNPITVLQFL